MKEVRKTCITGKLPPPAGTSEWVVFSQDSLCVDKTRMIKELVDTNSNDLITEIVSLGLAFRGKKAVLCKG